MLIYALLLCDSLSPKPFPEKGCRVISVHSDLSLASEMAVKYCTVVGGDNCIHYMFSQEMQLAPALDAISESK